MKNKYDLLFEYFNKQKEILSLLEESNNIVSELFNNHKEDKFEIALNDHDEIDHRTNVNMKKEWFRELIYDSLKPTELANIDKVEYDKWYTFRYHDSRGRRKYIQYDRFKKRYSISGINIVRPTIVTRTGYRAGYNVIFRTRKEAIEFFVKFMSSDLRRDIDEYEMEAWKIVKVPKRVMNSQLLERHWSADYGWFTV